MSKKCCCVCCRNSRVGNSPVGNSCGGNICGGNSCGGNGLLILILIALQFKCRRGHHDDDECGTGCIDNSILYLITLYYLICYSNRFSLGCGL